VFALCREYVAWGKGGCGVLTGCSLADFGGGNYVWRRPNNWTSSANLPPTARPRGRWLL